MRQELERGSRLTPTGANPKNYLNADHRIKSWLLTRDHKRIALLYLISISFFFLLGGAYALSIRLELLTPQGDMFQSATYRVRPSYETARSIGRKSPAERSGTAKSIASATLKVEPSGANRKAWTLPLPHSAQKPTPRYDSGQASSL